MLTRAHSCTFRRCCAALPPCRFVGLLLVVRLLPQGGDDAIRRVVRALGWRFIARLLLPLSPAHPPPPQQAQHAQQAELTCSLGLSVLSAACRLPDLASCPEALGLAPTLAAVVMAGGVAACLGRQPSPPRPAPPGVSSQSASALDGGDSADDPTAMSEALEALVAMGSAGGAGARAALWQGGALAAGLAELRRLAGRGEQGAAQQRAQAQEQGGVSGWARGVLAARLLGLLLGGDPGQPGQPGLQGTYMCLCVFVCVCV